MSKIRLRYSGESHPVRNDILQIFANFGIKCSKLLLPSENFKDILVFCNSDLDADRIFDSDCLIALDAIQCTPAMPMYLSAKRSVIVRRVDGFIYMDNSTDEILAEINVRNEDLDVISVLKFPKSRTMKVTFKCQEMAVKCLKIGMKMFNLFVSPSDIHEEEYYDIKICYKCYVWDSHLAHQCHKPEDFVVCSNCAERGHTFKTCTSSVKICLNCKGDHSAISFSCQVRKEAIKRLKASSVRHVTPPVASNNSDSVHARSMNCLNSSDDLLKSVLCLVVASAREKDSPGSYKETLSALQSVNCVPQFKLGEVPIPSVLSLKDASSLQRIDVDSAINSSDKSHSQIIKPGPSGISRSNCRPVKATSEKTVREETISNEVNCVASIRIFKKKTAPSITPMNLEKMFKEGHVIFENSGGLSQSECMKALKASLIDCKLALSKIQVRDFRSVKTSIN